MADVLRAIARLAQRTQHHGLQQGSVGAAFHLLEQLGVIARRRHLAAAQLQTELFQELAHRFQLFRRRAFMYAVQHRVLVFAQEVGGADVGRQHALLDQAVRVVAHHGNDALDLALAGKNHLRFDGLEVNRAALLARLQQHLEQGVQLVDMRQHGGKLTRRFAFRLGQHVGHLGVGQARVGKHHRGIEAVFPDFAPRADLHVAHHAQSLHFRVERAQPVG
ncbi:MAG: Uncharacterized protein FD134_2003 [Gallionellaceae bacterium]|nr:MAG: Uncharacterized protein FD134_2003 [Gallionellaceae bacterium]